MKTTVALSIAALALASCQQPAETKAPAAAASLPEGSAAAVARILAIPVMDRCGSGDASAPAPTTAQTIDLGGGAFAILADCQAFEGQPAWKTLHVQGADGVLKAQPLIVYNGPEYEEGYNWEVSPTSEATWDAAAKELVWVMTGQPNTGETRFDVSTMRWRWDGSKIAMVSASRVTHAASGAPATGEVAGFPTTPPTADPTPAATPVA